MGNKASYIHLQGSDLRPQFHQFTAVVSPPQGLRPSHGRPGDKEAETLPHPNVKPMAYANTLLQLGMM
ncbi:Serine/threonine-protein phosphatase 5 [Plecturocebus cupreus]